MDYEEVVNSLRQCLDIKNPEDSDDFEENDNQRVKANFLTPDGVPLPGISEVDSAFGRIEALRCYLEAQLGMERFIQAYNYLLVFFMQNPPENDDDNQQLHKMIGNRHSKYITLIYQMIVCEDACYKPQDFFSSIAYIYNYPNQKKSNSIIYIYYL